jgi:hypothetical protein
VALEVHEIKSLKNSMIGKNQKENPPMWQLLLVLINCFIGFYALLKRKETFLDIA